MGGSIELFTAALGGAFFPVVFTVICPLIGGIVSTLGNSFGLFISADLAGVCPYAVSSICRFGGNNSVIEIVGGSIKMLLTACSQTRIPMTVFVIFPGFCICVVVGWVYAVVACSADSAVCCFRTGSRAALMGVTRFGNILPVFLCCGHYLISAESVIDNNRCIAAVGDYFKDICKVVPYLVLCLCGGVYFYLRNVGLCIIEHISESIAFLKSHICYICYIGRKLNAFKVSAICKSSVVYLCNAFGYYNAL